jgi:hypothetical protein
MQLNKKNIQYRIKQISVAYERLREDYMTHSFT